MAKLILGVAMSALIAGTVGGVLLVARVSPRDAFLTALSAFALAMAAYALTLS